jgi:predicted lipid carrier protein YhbT
MIIAGSQYLESMMPTTPNNAQHAPNGPPPERWRFRWKLGALPIALLLGPWFFSEVDLPVRWRDLLAALHISSPENYSATAALAATLIAVLLILRLGRTAQDHEGSARHDA